MNLHETFRRSVPINRERSIIATDWLAYLLGIGLFAGASVGWFISSTVLGLCVGAVAGLVIGVALWLAVEPRCD